MQVREAVKDLCIYGEKIKVESLNLSEKLENLRKWVIWIGFGVFKAVRMSY